MISMSFNAKIDSAQDLQKYLFKNDYLKGFVVAKDHSNMLYVFTYKPWFGEFVAYWQGYPVSWFDTKTFQKGGFNN